jgi:DNA (cytosine-5)-methyltransferase 1
VDGIPTVDLFSGCGGLGIGARQAGADVRLSVDFDETSCRTLRANPSEVTGLVLQADVQGLNGAQVRDAAGLSTGDPLLVIGGPPCQGFSKAAYWMEDGDEARYRQARTRGHGLVRPSQAPRAPDSRRELVGEFWRVVSEADADAFVFENVPSILHPRNRGFIDGLLARATEAGYHCRVASLNAVQFGVPQARHRVVVVGSKAAMPAAPTPTHADPRRPDPGLPQAGTAGAALANVTSRALIEPEEIVAGRWAGHLRDVPPGRNYKFHTAWGGHPEPTFVAEQRFWNFLLKLDPGLPSWTIPANPGPWVGPFHWDSRRLRTAELAALQSFPDGYHFEGDRRQRVRQIGNAVPPPLAAHVVGLALDTMGAVSRRAA